MVSSFQRIAKGEGIKADKDALLEIAKLSDGSFRDGAKIIEEVSTNKSSITVDLIDKKYKTKSANKYALDLIDSFSNKDSKKGIKIVSDASSEGLDFKILTEDLINRLHENLISQIIEEKGDLSANETKELIKMLVKSHQSIKYALLPQLPLELTIVEWAALDSVTELASSSKGNVSSEEKELGTVISMENEKEVSGKKEEKHDNILVDLIEAVKLDNFSIAGVLRGCKVEKFDDKELTLSTNYKFHKERLNDKKIVALIESKLKSITKKDIKFKVI